MRFLVFSAAIPLRTKRNMPPCQSVLQRLRLEIEHNDFMIRPIAMVYKLLCKKKMKKRKTPAAAVWVTILGTRKRTRCGCLEPDLLTIAGAAKLNFLENPDQWRHFLDFPIRIRIRMPHESRRVAIHFFASHAACGRKLKSWYKESCSHNYDMRDFCRIPHPAYKDFWLYVVSMSASKSLVASLCTTHCHLILCSDGLLRSGGSSMAYACIFQMLMVLQHGSKVDDVAVLPFAASLRDNQSTLDGDSVCGTSRPREGAPQASRATVATLQVVDHSSNITGRISKGETKHWEELRTADSIW